MKALTLWQPWASLVARGEKTIETRSWPTDYRGPLAIHAAARPMRDARDCHGTADCFCPGADGLSGAPLVFPFEIAEICSVHGADVPLQAVIARCELLDVVPIIERDDTLAVAWSAHVAVAPGSGRLVHWKGRTAHDGAMGRPTWVTQDVEDQRHLGDFTPGRYAWLLDDIAPFDEPVPARGYQRLWEWTP